MTLRVVPDAKAKLLALNAIADELVTLAETIKRFAVNDDRIPAWRRRVRSVTYALIFLDDLSVIRGEREIVLSDHRGLPIVQLAIPEEFTRADA